MFLFCSFCNIFFLNKIFEQSVFLNFHLKQKNNMLFQNVLYLFFLYRNQKML